MVADVMLPMKERGKYPAIAQKGFNHGHTSYNKRPRTLVKWTKYNPSHVSLSTKPSGAK